MGIKAKFKNVSSQCNLSAQVEQVQDKTGYLGNRKIGMEFAKQTRKRGLLMCI